MGVNQAKARKISREAYRSTHPTKIMTVVKPFRSFEGGKNYATGDEVATAAQSSQQYTMCLAAGFGIAKRTTLDTVAFTHADVSNGTGEVAAGTIPNGMTIYSCTVVLTEAFNGTPTITVGKATDTDMVMTSAQVAPTATGTKTTMQTQSAVSGATAIKVYIAATTPTTGHGTITLVYN